MQRNACTQLLIDYTDVLSLLRYMFYTST